jgi:hypothetical protein
LKRVLIIALLSLMVHSMDYAKNIDHHTGTHLEPELLKKLVSPSPQLKSREEVLELLPKEGICAEIRSRGG